MTITKISDRKFIVMGKRLKCYEFKLIPSEVVIELKPYP